MVTRNKLNYFLNQMNEIVDDDDENEFDVISFDDEFEDDDDDEFEDDDDDEFEDDDEEF